MRTLTIAAATWRESIRQPVSIIVLFIAALVTFLSQFVNFFHFDEEAGFNVIRQMSVAQTLMCGIVIAIFSASAVLAEEIESRAVVTLLAKPVRRHEVVLGKFVGIMLAIVAAFVIMMAVSIVTAWWAEARFPKWRTNPALAATDLAALTTGQGTVSVAGSYQELITSREAQGLDYLQSLGDLLLLATGQSTQLAARAPLSAAGEAAEAPSPGLAAMVAELLEFGGERNALLLQAFLLAFVQTMIIAAVAVAVSTRLPVVFSALICSAVFVLGNVAWTLGRAVLEAQGERGAGGALLWLLKWPLAAALFLLPDLGSMDLAEALQVGTGPAPAHVWIEGALYGIVYTTLVLFVAVLLFERREVA